MKRGKKYQDAVKAFDKKEQYDVADAIALVKKNATAKFDETIELHLRTGCDGRHAEQQIRGAFENHFPWIHSTHVIVEYCKPIYMDDLEKTEKKHVAEKVREIIGEKVKKNAAEL